MIRFLRERQLLFPLVLILAAAAVLVLGAIEQGEVSQRQQTPVSEPPSVETPRPSVRAELDKTPLTYFADYWGQLAERAGPRLISVGQVPGLIVGPRLVLTTIAPALEVLEARDRPKLGGDPTAGNGGSRELSDLDGYRLRGWDEELGLALFDVRGDERVPFTLSDPRAMASGSYVGAVTLTPDGEPKVTPGYLVSTASSLTESGVGDLEVSMGLPPSLSVAAVVNLDGALIGVAHTSPNGPRVVSSTAMLEIIDRLQTERICRSVEVTDLTDRVRELMVLESGVLVEYVHDEAFAPEPSIFAGDILLEWDGTRVDSAEHFTTLYDAHTPGELVRYRVLRNRRRISGRTVVPNAECEPVGPEPVTLPSIGLALEWGAGSDAAAAELGWHVVAVAPDGAAAHAGVKEHDRVLSMDGFRLSDEESRKTIEDRVERGEPLLLSLERDQRRALVVVDPVEAEPEATVPEAERGGGSSS